MIGFDEALARVVALARPLGTEEILVEEAHGRTLAQEVVARITAPAADVSTMDGYAVRGRDLVPGAMLRVVGELFPGGGGGAIGAAECARIFTGAPLPEGADRVVMQEEVERDGEMARLASSLSSDCFVRVAGSDFRAGETLLPAGSRLGPRELVVAAAGDVARITVHRRPRVRILATGDELVAPGEALGGAGIPDSIGIGVAAMAREHGAEVFGTQRVGDDLAALRRKAGAALGEADVVVVTGGASVGERDFGRAMFADHELELVIDKVAMKPGKPVWVGRAGDRLVVGLPGNPTSALVTARLLLAPLLLGLCGARPQLDWRLLPLAARLPGAGPRETFSRGFEKGGSAHLLHPQDSGAQRILAQATLLIRRPPGEEPLAAGSEVATLSF
ncbi:molybdopterin molybdotransferase MoeA [Sphingomonas swuensis]|uniref:Molybdopterin molybdenumtransferase n=1 Tax=Sphingomonas swuensis TaxID=977800 RepID=A0ABP7SDF5_9SPHN